MESLRFEANAGDYPACRPSFGEAILDDTLAGLRAGCVPEAMQKLFTGLLQFRRDAGDEAWSHFAKHDFPAHPVRPLLHESPFGRRSFEKPRGYAGDAVLLDYIYDPSSMPCDTDLGHEISAFETQTTACRSVRSRKDILARTIDETAAEFARPRIASIACGHLREAAQAAAVRAGRIGEYLAIDQDRESLAVVEREYGLLGVTPVHDTVRSLLGGKSPFSGFHLVYAAGLYDYLPAPVAARLTAVLFQMLAPGGRLLVANFHPRLPAIGHMETAMGWWLIYRTESEMQLLSAEIEKREIDSHRIFRDPDQNVVFLEIRRVP